MSKVNDLDLDFRKFCVKILAGPAAGGNPCIYLNKGFNFNQFNKWMWFFRYKAALYQVQNPRHYVELFTTSYEYVPPKDELIKRLTNKITGCKREITKWNNVLRLAKERWDELFPIEEEEAWKKVVKKLEHQECQLRNYQLELKKIQEVHNA